jgi:DNA-binding protein H-NS
MTTELENIEAQIAELQLKKQKLLEGQRAEKLGEVKQIIQQFGFTAADFGLSGKGKRVLAKSKLEPKYVNPSNPNETWHGGRGARPNWVKEYLAKGGKLDSIEIRK